MKRTRTIIATDATLKAQEAWEAGTPPNDGEFSPDSLSGLILASGLKQGELAERIGRSPNTVRRWRVGALMENGQPFRPSSAEWAGIKMLAPKAGE